MHYVGDWTLPPVFILASHTAGKFTYEFEPEDARLWVRPNRKALVEKSRTMIVLGLTGR
jgi:hypothetical protein